MVLVLMSCLTLHAADPRIVRVGAFNYYPGIFKDSDGVVKGFYVDALADIAQRENIRFEYVYGSWSEGLERIKSGEVDLLTSVAFTPERAEFLDYVKTPLLTVWGELYVPLSSEIHGISTVQGKKIAVMKNDFNARHFIELVKKFDIPCEFVEVSGFEEVFKAVATGKVDAGVVNNTFGVAKQKEFGLRSTGVVFNPFDIFFAVAKGKNSDLLVMLDNYLNRWRHQADSTYSKARQKWSHGSDNVLHVVPRWLMTIVTVLAILALCAFAFIVILKKQVLSKTRSVIESSKRYQIVSERQSAILAAVPDIIMEIDTNKVYTWANAAGLEFFGDDVVGKEASFYFEGEQNTYEAVQTLFDKSEDVIYVENLQRRKDGTVRLLAWWCKPLVDERGVVTGTLSSVRDITEPRQIQAVDAFLAHAFSSSPTEPFFDALARFLAQSLQMDYICIDRLDGDHLNATTLAVWNDGHFEDNVTYALSDTPCGDVVGQMVCCFPASVCQFFPNDEALQKLRAESYVGVTLWSHSGQPIGLIAAISQRELTNRNHAELTLARVAVRAAAELERLESEAALRASEAFIKAVMDNLPIGVAVNSVNASVDFSYMNDNFPAMYRTTREALSVPDNFWNAVYEDPVIREEMRTRVLEDLASGDPARAHWEDVPLSRKGETTTYINACDTPFPGTPLMISSVWDVTERKQVEDELTGQKALFEAIFTCIPDAVVYTNVDREVLGINSAFTVIFGFSIDDLAGKKTAFFYESPEEYELQGKIRFNLTAAERALPYEVNYRRKDGSIFPGETLGTAIKTASGEVMGYIGIIRDITERKQAEKEKYTLEQQFQQTQKLESLGVLAGGIAHDFNNILAIIVGYCGLTKMDYEQAENHIPEIEKAAERAAALCRQMLAYAGKASLSQAPVNTWMLVDEMVSMLKTTIKHNVVIRPELGTDIPFIMGDASQLRQVVMNLIINAAEAIGDAEGEINIKLAQADIKEEQPEKDHLGFIIPTGRYIRFEVTDNGGGMDDETRSKIFEPFYTTKFTGRGLGMSAVLGIIKAHNGALQMESRLGHGTTFKVYLPVQFNSSESEKALQITASAAWQGSGTILLAEDEVQVKSIAMAMLQRLGFTVLEAANGKEALELYRQNAADITLVVTDMGMPVINGYDLFYKLKQLNPQLPIIISSGFGEADIASKIPGKEVAGMLNKPYRFEQLREVLMGVVERSGTPHA
jgi:PAS domain S-box-containing protein